MHKIRFPRWGAYSAPPDLIAIFKGGGGTSKVRAGKEGEGLIGRGEKGKGKMRGREGREGERPRPSKYFGLEPPLIPQSSGLEYSTHIHQLVIAPFSTTPTSRSAD